MSILSKLIEHVSNFVDSNSTGREIYFRGQRSNHTLLPALLRNRAKYSNTISIIESHYYCDAWVMAGNDLKDTKNTWEILAQFQHYQIPTRLLDWSSSLISAIYFSIEKCLSCKYQNSDCKIKSDYCKGNPTIWLLDPQGMHKHLHKKDCFRDNCAVTIGVDNIIDYKDAFITLSKKWPYSDGPLFMEIPWRNDRIKSQKGYFTFHTNEKPLDEIAKKAKWLSKVEIQQDDKIDLISEFKLLGIREHDIYPDLLSLGQYVNRLFQDF